VAARCESAVLFIRKIKTGAARCDTALFYAKFRFHGDTQNTCGTFRSMLQITEIIPEGFKQGTTRPLHCKASDGRYYVVKNRRTGTRGLIAEYVAARLARIRQLPVPDLVSFNETGKYDAPTAIRAFKALSLDRKDASDIYFVGEAWIKRVERLRAHGALPQQAIFTLQMPVDLSRRKDAEEIKLGLQSPSVIAVTLDETDKIKRLADVGIKQY